MNHEEFCPRCKTKLVFTQCNNTVHYGKLSCPKCEKWIKWVPKLVNVFKRKSKFSIEDVLKFHKKNVLKPFCFFCLRTKEQLGNHETFTVDHIEELSKSGKDSIENTQILCFACHKMKNWLRLYLNWHLSDKK